MNYKKLLCIIVLVVLLTQLSSAAPTPPAPHPDVYTRSRNVVIRLLCILLLLSPGIVFVIIVISGVLFIVGAENPEQRDLAKRLFKNALIGGVIVIALINIVKMDPLNIHISWEYCLGPGPPPVDGDGKVHGFLYSPRDGYVYAALPFMVPVFWRKWTRKK